MRYLPGLAVFLLPAAAAMAQHRLGFTSGWNTSFASRLGAITFEADVLAHFDDRNYQDWLLDPADLTGSTYKFDGLQFWLQDQDHLTLETFRVVAYNESQAVANQPGASWLRTNSINLPPAPQQPPWFTPFPVAAPIAWHVTITFPSTAVPSTPKGDKWFGINLPLPAAGIWPGDGLSTQTATDINTAFWFDKPGPGAASISNGQLSCYIPTQNGVPIGAPVFPSPIPGQREQIYMDVIARGPAGICTTQTNQTAYPSSHPGAGNSTPRGGTTNFLSGLHPDLRNASGSSPARADNIGFLVRYPPVPNTLVILGMSFSALPVSVPLRTQVPGSTGNLCLPPDATIIGVLGNGVAQFLFTNPPPVVPELHYQAFVLDPSGVIHASGCGIQYF